MKKISVAFRLLCLEDVNCVFFLSENIYVICSGGETGKDKPGSADICFLRDAEFT